MTPHPYAVLEIAADGAVTLWGPFSDETDADREREMLDAIRAEQHEYEQVESDA